MKEDFLHYVWKYKLFSMIDLQTTDNQSLNIVHSGGHNMNSGPDFLNATILIGDLKWAGNVEIHIKSSDWYVHNHEVDTKYDTVILHVVWEYDTDVYGKNNTPIPTLVLKNLVNVKLLSNYQNLVSKKLRWIPCEHGIATVDKFVLNNWLERLYFERLEQKSLKIKEMLIATNNDFEAVLFQLLSKNFGLKINGDAFLKLADSFDFSVLKKERFKPLNTNALLFGQAGFLEETIEDAYHKNLQTAYRYLQVKHQLKPMQKGQFQFFRMRPTNFPSIRIAQLASLYQRHQNLFTELMAFATKAQYCEFFQVKLPDFWLTHYTFQKESSKRIKKITKSFVDLLLINTIIPLKFTYLQSKGVVEETSFLKLIQQLEPEKNAIIAKFINLNIKAANAFETQALLELKNNYCTPKRCLDCAIGNALLRKKGDSV
ncbi:MAG: DUF2851 family protein [Flavobacteriaceae bacterium]|nr:DUF2851 family protein [Flavobacteriaceae bacterium]